MLGEAEAPLKPRLYCGRDLVEGELHPLGLGLAAIFTARCPLAAGVNEDACALIPYDEESGVIVVADGCGGLPGGERASEIAVSAIRATVRAAAKAGTELRGAVLDGIERANQQVSALGIGAGTTLAIAELSKNRVRTYHVGDSQIMIVGQMGKVKLTTMSHSPVGYALESGLIGEKEAMMHAERHLVSNLIGMPTMRIEVGPSIELSPKDTVIVASDGLFDNMSMSEIADTCRKGQLLAIAGDLREIVHGRMLEERAGILGKPDDLTFVAYRRRITVG